jgi:hypothetical protein
MQRNDAARWSKFEPFTHATMLRSFYHLAVEKKPPQVKTRDAFAKLGDDEQVAYITSLPGNIMHRAKCNPIELPWVCGFEFASMRESIFAVRCDLSTGHN